MVEGMAADWPRLLSRLAVAQAQAPGSKINVAPLQSQGLILSAA
jgi:hypothetical protein